MARSDAGQLKSDAGGSERLQDSAGAAFTQLLCQQWRQKWQPGITPRTQATKLTGELRKLALPGVETKERLLKKEEKALDELLKKLEKEKKKLMNKTILEKSGEVDNDGDTWLKIPKEGDDDIEMIDENGKIVKDDSDPALLFLLGVCFLHLLVEERTSLYPAMCVKHQLPCGKPETKNESNWNLYKTRSSEWTKQQKADFADFFGFVQVKVRTLRRDIVPLHGIKHTGKLEFPIMDKWTHTTLFSEEIKLGLKENQYDYILGEGIEFQRGMMVETTTTWTWTTRRRCWTLQRYRKKVIWLTSKAGMVIIE